MRTLLGALILLAATAQAGPALKNEGVLASGPGFSAYLVSYQSSGLKVHAMVAVPDAIRPDNGFPVVIANHGYVPDPRKYGITADGTNSRPGDYYRSVPELFTARGFLVVLPDYRGHNSSEGFEQIKEQNRESIRFYADDVVTLMGALADIDGANLEQVFMWSHSMGGPVSMHATLDTDIVKASSFWSTMSVTQLSEQFASIDGPIIIHHSIGDKSTESSNSKKLVDALQAINHPSTFYEYEGADHYFEGAMREQAADRDAEFFRSSIE